MSYLPVILLAIPLAAFLAALAAVADAYRPIPTDPFAPVCTDAPPISPVTQERTHASGKESN